MIVLWVSIAILIPVFLCNLYMIGKWKELEHTAYNLSDAHERAKLIRVSFTAGATVLIVTGLLFFLVRDRKK